MELNKELEAFILEMQQAEKEMQSGSHEKYVNLWKEDAGITAVGANGGLMLGEKVLEGPRRVASNPSKVRNTSYSNIKVRDFGDVAYTVWQHECETSATDSDEFVSMKMAVTHVLQKTDGKWKIVHRHNTFIK